MRTGGLLRDNGLSLVLGSLFVSVLAAQCVVGHADYNAERREHGETPLGFAAYLGSGHFLEAVFENWESEFLQMTLYVVLTALLFQRGSAESKDPARPDPVDADPREHRGAEAPLPVRRGGWTLRIYEHSLSAALGLLFLASLAGHAVSGALAYNESRSLHGAPPVSIGSYVLSSRFWFESFQNWQSEFLAVLALVLLSIWLRERGSPESKPVHYPHRSNR